MYRRYYNAGYVILINGGDIKFKGTTNSLDISEGSSFSPFALAINPEGSVVIFDESTAITYSDSIGTKGMVDIVQIDGGDVTIQGTVKTGSISFTTARSATLSLNNTSIINGSITTTGNKIHTLAISNDLTTGASGVVVR